MVDNRTIPHQLNGLSLLRVMSVTMILIVHFGQSIPLPDILHTPIVWCRHGVQMFYLLSGFLIFASLTRNHNLTQFYKKRVVRIVPIYYAVIIVNILLFDCILDIMPDDNLGIRWWRYFLFLQTMIPSVSVDCWNNISALWTMSAFALFYLVAPLLWKISKRGIVMCLVCISVLYLTAIVATTIYINLPVSDELLNSLQYLGNKNALSQLWVFAVGGGIFVLKDTTWAKYIIPMSFAFIGLIYNKNSVVMVCCFSVVIASIGLVELKTSERWFKVLKTMDEYSFAIYLGHTTMIEFMAALRDIYNISMPIVGLCSVIGTVLLIWCLHKFIEKPTAKYFSHHS